MFSLHSISRFVSLVSPSKVLVEPSIFERKYHLLREPLTMLFRRTRKTVTVEY